MRALVLLSGLAALAGCEYDSHGFPDQPDPVVDVEVDAGAPAKEGDAAPTMPPPNLPDAEVDKSQFGEPCTTGDECEGGMCEEFDGQSLCTQPCATPDDCPNRRACDEDGYCRMDWGGGGRTGS